MAYSKVSICNIALSMLGAAAIRDFNESNKRARMCDVFFDQVSGFLLMKHDWPFARKFVKLKEVVPEIGTVPTSMKAFALPLDCKIPRDIQPKGNRIRWEQVGSTIHVSATLEEVGLYYTANDISVAQFSDGFATVTALGMASRMCMAIAQDKAFAKSLKEEFVFDQNDVYETEANVGNEYKDPDDVPENDTFVNPPGGDHLRTIFPGHANT